ncbi:MAG: hypothetical protein WA005_10715 [Candidatus Binataceae bacterium]
MPRGRRRGVSASSAFRQIQSQARALVASLHKEIHVRQTELNRLKVEESKLSTLMGHPATAALAGPGPVAGPIGRGRINWRAVLGQIPRQFKARDIRNVRGLKGKRPSEIFAAITRWIDSGLVKRKARGLYERG